MRGKGGSLVTWHIPRRVSRPTSGGGLKLRGPSRCPETWSRLLVNVIRRHVLLMQKGSERAPDPERPPSPKFQAHHGKPVEWGRIFFPLPRLVLRTRDLDGIGDAYTLGVSTDFIINGLLCLHLSVADIKSGSRSGVRCDPSRFNLIFIPRCIWMFQDQGVVRNGTRKKLKRTRYAQRHFIVVCHAQALATHQYSCANT